VRDLLLRHVPKDFDIATNAHPDDVRKLFRNCRLIGRRFRLAHILFGRDIIEVATFRAAHSGSAEGHVDDESGRIMRDNIYGDLSDDAWRRDFTINALYYDFSNFSVIDITGGMADLKAQLIRMIGEPVVRYQEDPVRMLRAVRFAAKLNFEIEAKTAAGMAPCLDLLRDIATSRLFDETLKIFHSGYALASFELLRQYQLFGILFPETETALRSPYGKILLALLRAVLNSTDERIQLDKPVTPAFLFAALLWHPLQIRADKLQAAGLPPLAAIEKAINDVIYQQNLVTSVPRRISQVVREIWVLQYRLTRRYGRRAFRLLEHPRFRAGYDFLLQRINAGEEDPELGQWWTEFQDSDDETRQAMVDEITAQPRRRGRRKPAGDTGA
jgi:poly(A) polymerase